VDWGYCVQVKNLVYGLLCAAFSATAFAALTPEQARFLPQASARPVSFSQDIKPILEARCVQCHGRGRDKGRLRIDTRESLLQGGDSGPAVKTGKSQESLLIELVSGLDPDDVMPKKGTRLTAEQVGLLRAWIDQGLPWDAGVTFAKPAPLNLAPPAPKVEVSASSPLNPIDQILAPYFAARQVRPGGVVEDRVFARRVYLDAIGLLPPAEELEAFVRDEQPGKRTQLVKRVLAQDRPYAEHWLSFWNDLLRNDYRGTGYIDGGRQQISAWLFDALATNMPYDRFVAQLVNPAPGSAGFINGIVWRGAVNASQTPALQAAQNLSQVFLGVNLKCASCHDSFINDWRLADAYGLAGVFSDGPLEMFLCDKPTGKTAEARFIYPELGEIDAKADKPARLKRLAELMTGPENGRLPRTIVNRLWARLFGRGLVEPVDDMEQPAWDQDLLDWLAKDLVANRYDLKHTLEVMLTSRACQLPAVDLGETVSKDYVFRGPGVRRLSAEEFRDALGRLTGVWYEKAELAVATNMIRAALVPADPLALALGRPNREQVVTTRATAATTLQTLELTHGQTLADVLRRGAAKLVESSSTPGELVDHLYNSALGRAPGALEKQLAAELLGQPARPEGAEDLLWAVAMLPEFQLVQ
jgi:mono/diheme cytochrome c family protein